MQLVRSLIAFATIGLLSGACTQIVWHKNGASQDDFYKDKYACMQNTYAMSSGSSPPPIPQQQTYIGGGRPDYASSINQAAQTSVFAANQDAQQRARDQFFSACMQAKGWVPMQQ